MARFLFPLLVVTLGGLAGPSPAPAQPGRPGAPEAPQRPRVQMLIPGSDRPEPEVDDPRPFLDPKFAKNLPKDPDGKNLKDLLDKLNKLPKDQQPDKAQIEQLLKNNPAFKDPKFLEQLKKMLQDPNFPQNLQGKLPDGVPVPDKDQGAQLKDKLEEILKSGQGTGADPLVRKDGTGPKIDGDLPDVPQVPGGPQQSPYADNKWVQWMEKNFGDSPAAKDAIKDLVKSMEAGDLKGMFDGMPDLKDGAWKGMDDWGKLEGGKDWKIDPPDMSLGKGQSWGGGGGSSSWGGGSGSLGGGGLELGGGGTALAVIAGIAGALFLVVLLFRRWKLDEARRLAQGVGGPAGIDFDTIRTREELVRAFDHVSIDQIGDEARSWNHRVIADQFAEAKPTRAAPAAELAGLYERARYAPLDEDLSAGEFADARRDLRAIAEPPA